MSSRQFEAFLSEHPEWRVSLEELAAQIQEMPLGRRIKPRVIARQARIPTWDALALLRVLEEAGLGQIRIQVRDLKRGGLELATYRNVAEIPDTLEDSLGDPIEIGPDALQVVFVPQRDILLAQEGQPS
jgi:hypothetical protein